MLLNHILNYFLIPLTWIRAVTQYSVHVGLQILAILFLMFLVWFIRRIFSNV